MQDLTPVGLSKDGSKLLLVSPSGEDFAVPVDTRLRAALRGDNARLGQLEMKMESALRPRDIQARIRAGESPEDVAEAAQTSVDAIMGFATPVLAERAHLARTAQRASLRGRSGDPGSARTLGEAAEIYFSEHGLHDDDVSWDSWRRPDGRWALVAEYSVSGSPRRAEFIHDVPGRYVVAENDEARMLTGETRPPEAPRAGARGAAPSGRRLAAVPSQDELPLGDDAIELVRDREDSPAPPDASAPGAEHEGRPDADWISAVDAPTPDTPASAPGETTTPAQDDDSAEAPAEDDDPDAQEDGSASTDRPRKKGRAKVPSWDEIMFGGGKNE